MSGWRKNFITRIHVSHRGREFTNLVFFKCCSKWIEVYFCLRAFFQSLQLFPHDVYPFSLSIIISTFPYFAPKWFCFPRIRLRVYLRAFSPYLQVEFSFVVLECPALSVLFDLIPISFQSSFFRQYLLIYLFKLYRLFSSCCFALFVPTYSRVFLQSLYYCLLSKLFLFPV